MIGVALGLWLLFLVLAYFYARAARHPNTRPLAAYLIFVSVFTVAAFGLFVALTLVLGALGRPGALEQPVAAAAFLILVFVPAFFLARWQLKRPPRQAPPV